MTDEQIESLIGEISTELDRLTKEEANLGKEERKRKRILLTRRDIILKLKIARSQGNRSDETRTLAMYHMFTMYGHKNALLVNLFMSKFRGGMM